MKTPDQIRTKREQIYQSYTKLKARWFKLPKTKRLIEFHYSNLIFIDLVIRSLADCKTDEEIKNYLIWKKDCVEKYLEKINRYVWLSGSTKAYNEWMLKKEKEKNNLAFINWALGNKYVEYEDTNEYISSCNYEGCHNNDFIVPAT